MKDISQLKDAWEYIASVNRSVRHLRDFSFVAEILLHVSLRRIFQFRCSSRYLQRKCVDSHVASVNTAQHQHQTLDQRHPDRSSVDLAADSGGVVSLRNRSFHPSQMPRSADFRVREYRFRRAAREIAYPLGNCENGQRGSFRLLGRSYILAETGTQNDAEGFALW